MTHRVIVPVYIPNAEGYFEHASEILNLCLESLYLTTRGVAHITVIANGCHEHIVQGLRSRLHKGRIQELILNVRNWGKIDAALSVVRSSFEPLVTIADADVLFRPGWLHAVEGVLRAFPECAFATPLPTPSVTYGHTSCTILSAALSRELQFESVVPERDLDRFAHSIGRPDLLRPEQRRLQMTVRRGNVSACVGGGHCVFTLRREVARRLPQEPSLTALKPLGETAWFDDPPDAMGFWRLSTPHVYAHHMGNVPEPWMHEELEACRLALPPQRTPSAALPTLRPSRLRAVPFPLRKWAVNAVRRVHLDPRWAAAARQVHSA